MIVDFHTHVFPDKIAKRALDKLKHNSHTEPFSDGTLESLIMKERADGIDISVIQPVATTPEQVISINNKARENNDIYERRGAVSFAAIHPDFKDYKAELNRIKEMGFRGIKIHPVYQGVNIDDIRFLRIIEKAAELGLIVLTHGGIDIGFLDSVKCSPKMIRHVIDEIGDFKFVAAHMGGWKNWDEVPEYLADTNVYLDTSFSTGKLTPLDDGYYKTEELELLTQDEFIKLLNAFGAERIIFGTDSPWGNPENDIAFIKKLPVSEKEKSEILGENAESLCHFTNCKQV